MMLFRSLVLGVAITIVPFLASGAPSGTGDSVRKLYVGDNAHDSIDIFEAGTIDPKQIGRITAGVSGPTDVFVDGHETLYVANGKSATVTVYAAAQNVPNRTLDLSGYSPSYITVGPDGTIYVMVYQGGKTSAYRVLEFDLGANAPSRIIKLARSFPYATTATGIAVDAANQLYVNEGSYNSGGGFTILVFRPKSLVANMAFGLGPNYPGGALEIDKENQIIAGDPYDGAILAAQLPVQSDRPPFRGFHSRHSGNSLALDRRSQYLYSASNVGPLIDIFAYRSGQYLGAIHLKGIGGIAVSPPSL